MRTQIKLCDMQAPRTMNALMLVDRADINALVDFIETALTAHADSKLFSLLMSRNHFMTRHQLLENGKVDKDVYVINRKAFFHFIKAARFFVGNARWASAPVVKEMVV